ncbi:hypothetical protein FOCC_FOCC000003 [Frankliniella occidentalis]|nr:hypothetical protein FOCC_FOCC000003 [Frankliniella occidentalis]
MPFAPSLLFSPGLGSGPAMRPDLACTVFLACLELLKCVEVTQADRVKPSCLMQVASAAPVPCGYFEHSDACCIEPLDTRHVQSTQRHLAGGVQGPSWQQHSNVTFTAPTEDALYLVSHDEGCGPEHECWEVSLRALGPLESLLLPAGAALQVLVSHLPGPKAYNVSLTTATVSRGGSGPGPAPRPGSSTEDCRLLRGSTPVLDIVGDDASVRLVPPGVPQQGDAEPDALPALPGVCVTLHSDQCPVDCRDFTVPPQCRRTRFHQTERCVDKPFDSALTFRNVTRLNVSSRLDAGPVNSSHVVPLLFHCARLQLGGCVVATATVAVPLHPPSVRAEVMVPDKWTTTSNAVVLAAALTLLCVLLLFAVRNFCRGDGHARGPAAAGGGPRAAGLDRAGRRVHVPGAGRDAGPRRGAQAHHHRPGPGHLPEPRRAPPPKLPHRHPGDRRLRHALPRRRPGGGDSWAGGRGDTIGKAVPGRRVEVKEICQPV